MKFTFDRSFVMIFEGISKEVTSKPRVGDGLRGDDEEEAWRTQRLVHHGR
jgi:hypothetical protein